MSSVNKNLMLNITRVGFNLVFPIIVFPIVSKTLGPEYLGKVNFATSFVSYFILISSVGIPTYGIVICAKNRNDKEKLKKCVCELLYINLFFVILSYILLILVVCFSEKLKEYGVLIAINSLSICFTAIGMDWFFNALEKFQYITSLSIIFKVISFFLIIIMVHDKDDYYVYALITVLATVGSNLCNFIYARPYLHCYRLSEINIKRHLIPIMTFFAASIAGTINANTDTLMIGILDGNYSVGIYSFSVKIKNLLVSVMSAGLTVFIPRFSKFVSEGRDRKFREEFRIVVILTMSIAIATSGYVILFVNEIILLLGGKSYMEAKSSIIVLTLCIIILGMTWTLGVGVLQVIGREKYYTKTIIVACIINVVLNTLLIPQLHSVGASIATLFTEICNMLLFYYYSKDYLQNCLKGNKLFRVIGIVIIDYVILHSVKECFAGLQLILVLFIGAILYFSIFGFLVFLAHNEIRNIVKSFLQGYKKNISK